MNFHYSRYIVGSITRNLTDNEEGKKNHYRKCTDAEPQKLLKFWGEDYSYLSKVENSDRSKRLLPLPVNSMAQRIIESLSRPFQFK